jgi:RNA polymerase sigma factor (sigma-70 family)
LTILPRCHHRGALSSSIVGEFVIIIIQQPFQQHSSQSSIIMQQHQEQRDAGTMAMANAKQQHLFDRSSSSPSSSPRPPRRLRRRATILQLLLLALADPVSGFLSPSSSNFAGQRPAHLQPTGKRGSNRITTSSSAIAPLAAAAVAIPEMMTQKTSGYSKTTTTNGGMKTAAPSSSRQMLLLSDAEHEQCLQDVLELRRIRVILKKEDANSSFFAIQKSQACGYGNDIHAFETAIQKGERSRELLITNHLPLVRFVVNDLTRNRKQSAHGTILDREDLVQEGVIGLARALEKYDPSHNTKLSTYSVFWIRAVVLRALAEKDSPVYVPENIRQTAAKLGSTSRYNDHWHEAKEAKQLAESLGVSDRHLREALKVHQRTFLSYEAIMAQQGDGWMDRQQQQSEHCDENDDGGVDLRFLKHALSTFLGPREVEALAWRYGLNGAEPTDASLSSKRRPIGKAKTTTGFGGSTGTGGRGGEDMSFQEVGVQMHVSAEYCRRLVHRALKKLHQAVAEGNLELAALVP